MNWAEWGGVVVVVVWGMGVLVAVGVLWERERLLNPDAKGEWRWLGALVLCAVLWPLVRVLWGPSRPAPPQPPEPASYVPGPGRTFNFHDKDLEVRERWVYLPDAAVQVDSVQPQPLPGYVLLPPSVGEAYGGLVLRVPHDLALAEHHLGARAWVMSLGFELTRSNTSWVGECGCRYNFSGFLVIQCRKHQTDRDPQGEPDESEGDVGR